MAGQGLIAVALLFLGASVDPVSKTAIECEQKPAAEQNECLRQVANLPPIGSVAVKDTTIIRVLITAHEQIPDYWIELSRHLAETPEVRVQSLIDPGFNVRTDLSISDWDDLQKIALSSELEHAKPSSGFCIAIGFAHFEVANDGKVTQFDNDGCQPEFRLVNHLIDRVTRAIPECTKVPEVSESDTVGRLEACASRETRPKPSP